MVTPDPPHATNFCPLGAVAFTVYAPEATEEAASGFALDNDADGTAIVPPETNVVDGEPLTHL
jgi:hypothetical protein